MVTSKAPSLKSPGVFMLFVLILKKLFRFKVVAGIISPLPRSKKVKQEIQLKKESCPPKWDIERNGSERGRGQERGETALGSLRSLIFVFAAIPHLGTCSQAISLLVYSFQ